MNSELEPSLIESGKFVLLRTMSLDASESCRQVLSQFNVNFSTLSKMVRRCHKDVPRRPLLIVTSSRVEQVANSSCLPSCV